MTGLATENRLRWLCRRGMLELDTWLKRYFERCYPSLTDAQRVVFAHLLEQDDMALYDWLTGEHAPPDEYRKMVEEIRNIRTMT